MMRLLSKLLSPSIALVSIFHAQDGSTLPTQKILPLDLEVQAAQAAIAACAAQQIYVHAYVVDTVGNIKLLIVGDGGKYATVEGARRKAYTAAITGRPTIEWQKMLAANPNATVPTDPKMLFLGGGVPIRSGNELLGALSVGGGRPDAVCAQAGLDKIQSYLQ